MNGCCIYTTDQQRASICLSIYHTGASFHNKRPMMEQIYKCIRVASSYSVRLVLSSDLCKHGNITASGAATDRSLSWATGNASWAKSKSADTCFMGRVLMSELQNPQCCLHGNTGGGDAVNLVWLKAGKHYWRCLVRLFRSVPNPREACHPQGRKLVRRLILLKF